MNQIQRKILGECKSLRVKCISELGWHNTALYLKDRDQTGGQYEKHWNPSNAAGVCTHIEIESLKGVKSNYLLDVGWNISYMKEALQREGVNNLLLENKINGVIISHEHRDHLWGLQSILSFNSKVNLYFPSSFTNNSINFIKGIPPLSVHPRAGIQNTTKYEGNSTKLEADKMQILEEGLGAVTFDVEFPDIFGETVLYANVKNKGIVLIIGCGHPGYLRIREYAKNYIPHSPLYGLYGGLHFSPFDFDLKSEHISDLRQIKEDEYKIIALNHCTGIKAIQELREMGIQVVKGNGRFGSKSDLYLGNGDYINI